MPDAIAEFEASLNAPVEGQQSPPVVQPPETQQVTPEPSPAAKRSLIEAFRESGFNTLPEDWDDEALANHLVAIQERAELAAQLEQEKATWEAQRAADLLKQQQQPTAPTAKEAVQQQPPAESVSEFPFKPYLADRTLQGLVRFDPETRMYVPAKPASLPHMQAAEEFNKELQYRSQIDNELYGNPEQFFRKVMDFVMADAGKKYDERIEAIAKKLDPVAEYVNSKTSEAKQAELLQKHGSKLWNDDGLTPLGQEVQWLVDECGVPLETAIAKVEAKHGGQQQHTQATPSAPVSISKVARTQQQQQAPQRMIDGALQRMRKQGQPPPDRTVYDRRPTRWNASVEEVLNEIDSQSANN